MNGSLITGLLKKWIFRLEQFFKKFCYQRSFILFNVKETSVSFYTSHLFFKKGQTLHSWADLTDEERDAIMRQWNGSLKSSENDFLCKNKEKIDNIIVVTQEQCLN